MNIPYETKDRLTKWMRVWGYGGPPYTKESFKIARKLIKHPETAILYINHYHGSVRYIVERIMGIK